ncbi:MAG: TRAP transporter large permease subunit [Steroidobacteraceae bacterium]|jgi:tripartite ATP-independent transporter DctM subunit|nr:TRAP transporter large permease subunit [Steroidobacteraceae bacterium]
MEWLSLVLFALIVVALLAGYPVAFTLAGVSLMFATVAAAFGAFDLVYLEALPSRIFGTMSNSTLVAVPLFVFMGLVLERARIADELLETLGLVFGRLRGGLAVSVIVVGALLAASTGIVGATVVTMGLLSLPVMLRHGYDRRVAAGTICASGTLGQIIPPSIILVLLGDVLSSAYQQAQLKMGIFSPKAVSVGELFVGALLPGLLLVGIYVVYVLLVAWLRPASMPALEAHEVHESRGALALRLLRALVMPLVLILAVLGSILAGYATPTEAAAVGAVGALLLALLRRSLDLPRLREVMQGTVRLSSMVFLILIGASVFSLVFRGFGGDDLMHDLLGQLPGGVTGALIAVMLVLFLLGFIIDFIEITYIVVPVVAPVLLAMGVDPVWLGVMIAVNLQTSFLTPPFGFALFYLRGVAPPEMSSADIYRGAMPFVALQLGLLVVLALWPQLATWLPQVVYGN